MGLAVVVDGVAEVGEEALELGNPLSVLENVHSGRAADVIGKRVVSGVIGKVVDLKGNQEVALVEETEKVEEVDMKGKKEVDSRVEAVEGADSVEEEGEDVVEGSVGVVGIAETAEVVVVTDTSPIPVPFVPHTPFTQPPTFSYTL